MTQTPYEILGVAKSASQDEIKDAYRKLAKKFHPDLNPGNKEAEKRFKDINGAYELVGTPESRAKYDRGETDEAAGQYGRTRQGPFYRDTQQQGGRYSYSAEGFDEDFFSSIFGGAMGGAGARRGNVRMAGQDELYQMEIDFKEAVLGGEREITLPSGKRLRVKIPAGIESGNKLRFSGQGGAGIGGGPAGDAYVEVHVRPSPLFKRVGSDLELELPISFAEAVLGAEIKAPTIDGAVMLKIPPNVNTGGKLRIAGKGVPSASGAKRGDQIVVLKVVMPPEVDAELRRSIEEWSKRHAFNPREKLS